MKEWTPKDIGYFPNENINNARLVKKKQTLQHHQREKRCQRNGIERKKSAGTSRRGEQRADCS